MDNNPEAITTILRRFHEGLQAMGDFVTQPAKSIQYAFDFNSQIQKEEFMLLATEPYESALEEAIVTSLSPR